ncbi:MAG: helix-turn-helix transcriptional regulator [Candidatus Sericytochromatia bacterium]|nr:helix-turn-helix transcriptional regulator [Candidatus Sericytochromatia bacterium]
MAKKSYPPRRRELLLFGRRLRSWRKAKGWSQEKLALAAGLDFSYVNEIENGKLNPGLLTLLILSNALEISPAALFLPPAEAKRLQKSPLIQADLLENSLTAYLDKTELLESHCQLVLHYAQQGEWRGAQKWLNALHQIFPDNRYVDYTQARYHCLRIERLLAQAPSLQKVAEPQERYPLAIAELSAELQAAFQALEQALAEPTLWETMRESPDLNVLKKQAPEQWRALIEKMRF